MSQDALRFIFTSGAFTSGALGVYYDFNSYSGDKINSLAPAFTGATGQILGSVSNFTGTAPGSGYFENNAIQINDAHNLFSKDAAFIFSQKKVTDEPVTVFSNLVDLGTSGSGIEIGINATNNLYVKTFNNNTPTVYSANTQAPEQSLRSVYFQRENVYLGTYDLRQNEFIYDSFPINSRFVNNNSGTRWLVGSGEYNAPLYMDLFIYCRGPIGMQSINALGRTAYNEYYYNPAISGTISGVVTGMQVTTTGNTGVRYEYVLSGYEAWNKTFYSSSGKNITAPGSSGVSGQTIIYDTLLTGLSGFGEPYGLLPSEPTGLYATIISSGSEVGTILTGASGFSQSVTVNFSGAVYIKSGISGLSTTGYSYSGITGASEPYIISGAQSGVRGSIPARYNFTSLTYNQLRGTGNDFVEYDLFSSGKSNINRRARNTRSYLVPGNVFDLQEDYDSAQLNFNVNGVGFFAGGVSGSTGPNGRILTVTGDYYVTGSLLIPASLTNLFDQGIFDSDIVTNRSRFLITGIGDSWGDPDNTLPVLRPSFNWPQALNAQVYLNGIRLASGVDYEMTYVGPDPYFNPLGTQLTGITGSLYAYEKYPNASYVSGVDSFDIYNQSFSANTFNAFVNGVRQDPDNFIQYSATASLITGGIISQKTRSSIYNKVIK